MRTMKTKVVAIIMAVAMVFALGMTSLAATKGYNQLSVGDTLNAGDKIRNDSGRNLTLTIEDGGSSSQRTVGNNQTYTIPSGKVATVTDKSSTGSGMSKRYTMTISLAAPAPGPTPETVTVDFEQITIGTTLNEGDSITNKNHNSPVVVTVTTDGTESTVNINRNGSYTIPAGYTAEVTSKTSSFYSHDYKLSITLTAIPEGGDGEEHLTPEQRRALSIDAFVENMYIDVLGRQFDADGRIEFIVALNDNEMTGADVVRAMFNSEEYAARNQTDEEFIATLCQVMAHRAPTDAEIATWTTALASGTTRAQVVDTFLATEEFASVCAFFQVNV